LPWVQLISVLIFCKIVSTEGVAGALFSGLNPRRCPLAREPQKDF
jgi:hypothetical protein